MRFFDREAGLDGEIFVNDARQVFHAPINEVVFGLESLSEVVKHVVDLSCVSFPSICHISNVELSERFVLTCQLFDFKRLSGHGALCFLEFDPSSFEFFLHGN